MNRINNKDSISQRKNFQKGIVKSRTGRTGIESSKVSLPKSPYLSAEKIQVLSHCLTEKRIHRKVTETDMKRGKIISDIHQPMRRNMRKSVLTLPTAMCDTPVCPQCHGESNCDVCKTPFKITRQHTRQRTRQTKPSLMGDKITTDSEQNATEDDECKILQQSDFKKEKTFQDKTINSLRNTTQGKRNLIPEKDMSSHDVWNILREINKNQFNRASLQISDESILFDTKQKTRNICKRRNKGRVIESTRKEEITYFSSFEIEDHKNIVESNESSIICGTLVDKNCKPEIVDDLQYTREWMCNNANRLANERAHTYAIRMKDSIGQFSTRNSTHNTNARNNLISARKYSMGTRRINEVDPNKNGKESQHILPFRRPTKNINHNSTTQKDMARKFDIETKSIHRNALSAVSRIRNGNALKITCSNLKYPVIILGRDVCAAVTVPEYKAPQFVNMRGIWQYMIGWSTDFKKDNSKPNKYLKLLAKQDKKNLVRSIKLPKMQRKLTQKGAIRKKDFLKNQIDYIDDSKDLKVLFQNVNDFCTSAMKLNQKSMTNKRNEAKVNSKTGNNKMYDSTDKCISELLKKSSNANSATERNTVIDIVIEKIKKENTPSTIETNKLIQQRLINPYNRLTRSKEAINAKIRETLNKLEQNHFFNNGSLAENALSKPSDKLHELTHTKKNYESEIKATRKFGDTSKRKEYENNIFVKPEQIISKNKLPKYMIKKSYAEPLISAQTSPTTIIQKTVADSVDSYDFIPEILACLNPRKIMANKRNNASDPSRLMTSKLSTPSIRLDVNDSALARELTSKNSGYANELTPKMYNKWNRSKEILNTKIESALNKKFYDYDDWTHQTILKSKKFPFHQRWTLSKKRRNYDQAIKQCGNNTEILWPIEKDRCSSIQKQSTGKRGMKLLKSRKKLDEKYIMPYLPSPKTNVQEADKDVSSVTGQSCAMISIPGFSTCPEKVFFKTPGRHEVIIEVPSKDVIVYFEVIDKCLTLEELDQAFLSLSVMQMEKEHCFKANYKLCFATLPEQLCSLWPSLADILEKCCQTIAENRNQSNIALEDVVNKIIPPSIVQKSTLRLGKFNTNLYGKLRKKMKTMPRYWKKPVPYCSEIKNLLHNVNSNFMKEYTHLHKSISTSNITYRKNQNRFRRIVLTGSQNILGAVKLFYTPWFESKLKINGVLQHWVQEFISLLGRTIKLKHHRCIGSMVRLHQENTQLLTFCISEDVLQRFLTIISNDIFQLLFCRNSDNFEIKRSTCDGFDFMDKDYTNEDNHSEIDLNYSSSASTIKGAICSVPVYIKGRLRYKLRKPANFSKRNKLRLNSKKSAKRGRKNVLVPIREITNIKDFMKTMGAAVPSRVIDGNMATKILSTLVEFSPWSDSISPAQALLVLLLSTKAESQCLHKYRCGILQGIATRRISTCSDLDKECRLIELNEDIESAKSYDGQIVRELYHIAKETALKNERTFDEGAERAINSLLKRQRKLNPSYLRVMAKYVGLGLFNSPSKGSIKDV